jgi:hypothetical protein
MKRQGAMHLPKVCAHAATQCNCPVPIASPVPLGIQFLSTIQPTSQLVNTQKIYIIDDSTVVADFWIDSDVVL